MLDKLVTYVSENIPFSIWVTGLGAAVAGGLWCSWKVIFKDDWLMNNVSRLINRISRKKNVSTVKTKDVQRLAKMMTEHKERNDG